MVLANPNTSTNLWGPISRWLRPFAAVLLCLVGPARFAAAQRNWTNATASAYRVTCGLGDLSCEAWTEFRANHPFPYQSIEGKRLVDGTSAIFISEPAPVMPNETLDKLIKLAFGRDLVSATRLRWKLGVDGWLEDVVLRVRTAPSPANPISDPVFRDRIAFLYLALFGTTFGGNFDFEQEDHFALKRVAAPNLEVTTREVREWVGNTTLRWDRLDADGAGKSLWTAIAGAHTVGAFMAADQSLVLLTFPSGLLLRAQENPTVLEPLHIPFRCFAVASDALIGALVSPSGQIAIVGRSRTNSLSTVPPLRFETFQLVASQSSDELSQSYERTSIFSGRLENGDYRGKDWAPIYLSDALIDTEFGALLNTTDQMLKSWSEAGDTEYMYFNYPKPLIFPFGATPLSTLIREETGSSHVLFNWNTSGSAVVVDGISGKVLTARQTGALPVTYGSDMNGSGTLQTGKLLQEEETAYRYFATLKDANLERVVQYTMLYQFCQSITQGKITATLKNVVLDSNPGVVARHEAADVRAKATLELLNDLTSGRIRLKASAQQQATLELQRVHQAYPGLTLRQLANLLADRFSDDAMRIRKTRLAQFDARENQLQRQFDQFDADVKRFNQMLHSPAANELTVETRRADIERRRGELQVAEKDLRNAERQDPTVELSKSLWEIALDTGDLEKVRSMFVARHDYEPLGCIKTPSIVVSWDRKDVQAIGGHNLDARTLKLEPNSSVSGFALKETDKGLVLQYNPAKAPLVESHAAELARAVEHQHVRDVSELTKIALRPSQPVRPRSVALELPPSGGSRETWAGQIGHRTYTTKVEFVDDLRAIAEKNDCCIFVAHDSDEVAFATEQNLKPPPTVLVYEIRDTPSFDDFLKTTSDRIGTRGERAVIFFDTPEAHVRALGISAEGTPEVKLASMADILGERTSGDVESRLDGLAQRDLNGKESLLQSISRVTESRVKALFGRMTVREIATTWKGAEVTNLSRAEAEQFVSGIGWDSSRDGTPAAIALKFRSNLSKEPPMDVSVVAGFRDNDYTAGRAGLLASHEKNLRLAAAKQASIAQYTMTVRNELRKMPGINMRRFSVIVKNGETRTLMSWNGHQFVEREFAR